MEEIGALAERSPLSGSGSQTPCCSGTMPTPSSWIATVLGSAGTAGHLSNLKLLRELAAPAKEGERVEPIPVELRVVGRGEGR